MQKPWPVMLTAYSLGIGGSERQLCEIAKSLDSSNLAYHNSNN